MALSESPTALRARHFAELCELEEPARRLALARLAEQDAQLASDVARMLAFDRESIGPIEGLRDEVAAAAERQLLSDLPGEPPPPERLGPWRLGEKLGAGGMGEVWAAERVEGGFEQRAAVKLVRANMARSEVVARFAIERQLLARLDHPAIAKLLDGGVALDGRPWFAMERVDGVPITRFAADGDLDLRARIRLLLAVMEAVDFAHRSLVVHRDLKPSNILVTSAGAPKLLDFGLAKLLEPGFESGVDPNVTRTEFRALTPAYAAPEQILGEPVTTATDVYSLGMILYELLTGELPHRRRSSSAPTLVSDVADETIERPSLRLRRLGADANATSHAPRPGRSPIDADLDTIVLKALAREPKRRYASVPAFAADLHAYLEERPIAARPDSVRYRTGKFVLRHRLGVAAAAVALLSLVAGLSVSIVQTRRATAAAEAARQEAQRAERVKGFLVSVFEQADPTRTKGAEMPARQILEEGARRLTTGLADEPEVRAELFDTVAGIQSSLGLLDEALTSAGTAVAERARLFGPHSREHARSLTTLGVALVRRGRVQDAQTHLTQALADFAASGEEGSVDFARALSANAQVKFIGNDIAGARGDEKRAVAIFTTVLGGDDSETLEHLSNLAVLETEAGSFGEAARILRGVLARFEAIEGPDSAQALAVVVSLATALDTDGQSAEALPLFERAVAGMRKVYGPGHPTLAEALVITSLRLSRAGRQEEALADLAEARATYAPLDHPELAAVDNYSGLALADLGRFAEAEAAFLRARDRYARDRGAESTLTAVALANAANVVSEQGRAIEAEEMFERAVAALRVAGEFDNPRLVRMRLNWAGTLRKLGRVEAAREVIGEALTLANEKLGKGNLLISEAEVGLARLELAEGKAGAAERARTHLSAAEAGLTNKAPSPSLERSLAALRSELARSSS
ncbi:MAG: serine/threonine-protein kinase [Thermoanaerobaculia bacterium]